MSTAWRVRDSLGQRALARDAFPVSIGGAGSAILLAGAADGPQAWLGLHDDQLFLQPEAGATLLHNGAQVHHSAWLHTGDVITAGNATVRVQLEHGLRTLVVDEGGAGNATLPPVVAPAGASGGGEALQEVASIRYRAMQAAAAGARKPGFGRYVWLPVALLLLGLLWFVSTGVTLQLRLDPENSAIRLRGGWFSLRLGNQVFVRHGEYTVEASAPGYQSRTLPLRVTEASGQSLSVSLRKLPGRLKVQLPAAGTLVVGTGAPLAVPGEIELPAGRHDVAIAVPRYLPFKDNVEVKGAGQVQDYRPALTPDWAPVSISTDPAGAELLIDGKTQGLTPARMDLAAGSHKLELRLRGFSPWRNDVLVKANEAQSLGPIRLGLPDGAVNIQVTPAGARVLVGGIYRGQSPLRLALRPNVSATLSLEAPGYESAEQHISVGAGEVRALQFALKPVLGQLQITANIADAEVFADGQRLGPVGASYSLPAAEHQIEVKRSGYVDFKASVTPRPGMAQSVHADLLTAEQARVAKVPAYLKAHGGIELKLMPTGSYVMGSARREPARRANESQRQVQLKRPFYMGLREISNAEFRQFRAEHRSGFIANTSLNLDNQPVAGVSWADAAEFCNWLSQRDGLPLAYQRQGGELVAVTPMNTGYRLPSEAEWEWVARYRGGSATQRYPWGNDMPIAPRSGNYGDAAARVALQEGFADYDDDFVGSAPAGSYPPSALGLFDLGGNVAEWTNDLYAATFNGGDVLVDPLSSGPGNQHVVRGASWRSASVAELRLAARTPVASARDDLGFRIARYVE